MDIRATITVKARTASETLVALGIEPEAAELIHKVFTPVVVTALAHIEHLEDELAAALDELEEAEDKLDDAETHVANLEEDAVTNTERIKQLELALDTEKMNRLLDVLFR